ncbi:glycosyltransferase [Niveibacterium sp. COAC-50]|uniref:glycosyltransferase n=1 Tax=Niveibacterium sp. COAC-50 TaxID=2729384 RepID=UPI001555EA01|nr:glycosyltransferase [Niveibacterium sp. COAC-50]
MPKNILLVMLEFDNWLQARAWSYTGAWAFHDGLTAIGHNCTVFLATHGKKDDNPKELSARLRAVLKENSYDQVWIWCVHTNFDAEFWGLLRETIPIRIGILMESLSMTADEIAIVPQFSDRKLKTYAQLLNCTHALAVDEADVTSISNDLSIPTLWNTVSVPKRFITSLPPPVEEHAVFIGNKYGPRKEYLEDPQFAQILTRPHIPERNTTLPEQYDAAHAAYHALKDSGNAPPSTHNDHISVIATIRAKLFQLHLMGIRMGFCSVGLPSIVKAHTARVAEAMAASTPVVNWIPPQRPRCEALFVNQVEYIGYRDKTELLNILVTLKSDPELRHSMTIAGRDALTNRHTSEVAMHNFSLLRDNA